MSELQTFLGMIYAKSYIKNKYQKLSDEITERFTQNIFICKFSKKAPHFTKPDRNQKRILLFKLDMIFPTVF